MRSLGSGGTVTIPLAGSRSSDGAGGGAALLASASRPDEDSSDEPRYARTISPDVRAPDPAARAPPPSPSLPYGLDTSRPSSRTERTRLVPPPVQTLARILLSRSFGLDEAASARAPARQRRFLRSAVLPVLAVRGDGHGVSD